MTAAQGAEEIDLVLIVGIETGTLTGVAEEVETLDSVSNLVLRSVRVVAEKIVDFDLLEVGPAPVGSAPEAADPVEWIIETVPFAKVNRANPDAEWVLVWTGEPGVIVRGG